MELYDKLYILVDDYDMSLTDNINVNAMSLGPRIASAPFILGMLLLKHPASYLDLKLENGAGDGTSR